ncbi:MAG TPA: SAM-dependent chlorinase/fluorinase [Geminicoccaceae bacterium]
MIVLFTDFGLTGPYVGQVKAILARRAPGTPVIDLFADAPAFSPKLSAYLLAAYASWFEPGDVILGVVDPGVGGGRRGMVVEADGRWFVGPDNGLFELIRRRARTLRAWPLDEADAGAAPTFHGRDVFAPAAAGIAIGWRPREAQARVTAFDDWPDDLPAVVYVDHYGNAMTGIRAEILGPDDRLRAGGRTIARARTFTAVAPGHLLWYANANGLAEIALRDGAAAEALGIAPGTGIEILKGGEVAGGSDEP